MKTAELSKDLKRTDVFKINPNELYIDWESNPRIQYGEKDEWEEFKNQIKIDGVKQPIQITWDDEKGYMLTHGFRRMKAVTELIKEGHDILLVPCFKVKNNMEQILLDHIVLNSGKELTDLEKAETLIQLSKYGYEPKALAEKTGMSLIKVKTLLTFAADASKVLKDTVKEGKMSFTAASTVVREAKGNTQKQNEVIEKASKSTTKKKIRVSDVSAAAFNDKTYKKLVALLAKTENNAVDLIKIRTLENVIKFLSNKQDEETIIKFLKQ